MRGIGRSFVIVGIILSLAVFCSASVYDVTDYGATGNGSTHDHDAVNAAINAANAAGGGIVYFPPGTYKCGSIILKSNVTLNLHEDAEIQATMDYEYTMWDSFDCPGYDDDWGHSHWKCSLIWAVDQENIGITGSGFIDGTDPATNYTGLDKGDPDPGFADRATSFKNCTGVTIDGIRMLRGGHFAIIATGCTDVNLSNLFIDTNRDGINIDCCNDVTIINCIVNAPCDDAIGLKSSYGLCEKRATENVIVSGCYVSGYEVGSVMDGSPVPNTNPSCYSCGSIKFGTESYGGFKNITITDCTFENSRGFMLATVDGGDIENIYIDNIQMSLINDPPIFLRLGDRARNPGPPPPGTYRNVDINNITCSSAMSKISCIASGIPDHYIENVHLSNLNITYAGGGTEADAARVLEEKEDGYPYGGMFGVTPCYGFYARHVDGIIFNNCVFNLNSPDARPEFTFIDALNVEFDNFGIISDITSPSNGSLVYYGDEVTFNGYVSGGTPPYTYTWQSNVDGLLGTGQSLNISNLSVASSGGQITAHTITLTVEDSNNASDTDQIDLTVKFHADFEPDGDVDFEDCSIFSNDWLKDTGQMFLPEDPVAWWKLDEESGSIASDFSGNGNTGTLHNMDGSDWVTGYNDGALDFDGGNDYISVNDSSSVSVGGGDYTICAWIYPHSISGSRGIVAKVKSNSDKEYAFSLGNDDALDGALGLDVENNANDGAEYTAPIVTPGEWQHVMVIFDSAAKDAFFYHNFDPVPLYSSIPNPINALPRYFDDNLCIGRWGGSYESKYFDGIIDDVRIYDYSLMQANLQSDFNEDDTVDFKDFARLALEWLK